MSNLIIHKSLLQTIGYKDPPHYIGMLNHMWLWCSIGQHHSHHTLMVKSTDEWQYVCDTCNCGIVKVDFE